MKVVIIGGGIAGLTAAFRLRAESERAGMRDLDLTVLEGSDRLGGIIWTQKFQDAVIENGPDSFITTKPAGLELCEELGLINDLIRTNEQNRRALVAFRKKLHPVPEGFFMLAPSKILPMLTSPLFTIPGKLRMLLEVLLPPKRHVSDESLADFVRRRLGNEVLERIAQPMMAGIYTADPERLSLRSTMPQFLYYEQEHGSVILGLQEQMKQRDKNGAEDAGARYSMFVSLKGGMCSLIDALCDRVGRQNIWTNQKVSSVYRSHDGWHVAIENGATLKADAVVFALPAPIAAKLLYGINQKLADKLCSIPYASSMVLNLVYRKEDLPQPLKGFGFVVPAIEKRDILACSYSSVKFPNRAPEGMETLRVFMGGALRPELAAASEEDSLRAVAQDLHQYLGITADPVWYNVARWPNSMPQYHVGHADLIASLEATANDFPGISFAGNAFFGVGIPDCIRSGENAARHLLSRMTPELVT